LSDLHNHLSDLHNHLSDLHNHYSLIIVYLKAVTYVNKSIRNIFRIGAKPTNFTRQHD